MVYSADGIPGAEALAVQKRLAALLSNQLKQEYSEMCGFVRVRMSLEIVRSNSLLLRCPREKRGAHLAATRSDRWVSEGTASALGWINRGGIDVTDEKRGSQGRGNGFS